MLDRRLRRFLWLAPLALVVSAGLGVAWYTTRGDAGASLAPPAASRISPAPESDTDLPLDEAQRAFLWEVEHHGLLLGRHGFQPLADALSRGDTAALGNILAEDFSGEMLSEPREVRVATA